MKSFKVLPKIWIPSKILAKATFHVRSLQVPEKECINLKGSWKESICPQDPCKDILSFERTSQRMYNSQSRVSIPPPLPQAIPLGRWNPSIVGAGLAIDLPIANVVLVTT